MKNKERKIKLIINKRITFISIILIVIIAVALTFVFCILRQPDDNATVMTVNGDNVNLREFREALNDKRSYVYSYFYNKYGVEDSKDFWTTAYHGEIPAVVARKMASDYIINVKVQQQLSRQNNLIKDISYSSFLDDLKKKNESNAEAVAKNMVVYGKINFEEKEYYDYTFINLVKKLKDELAKKDLAISEKEIIEYYDKHKDDSFKIFPTVTVQRISLPYAGDKGSSNVTSKTIAEKNSGEIRARLENGESYEKISNSVSDASTIQTENQVFDDAAFQNDYAISSELRKAINSVKAVGQISDLFSENSAYNMIILKSSKDMGYKSLDTVKEEIKQILLDAKYKLLVDKIENEAKIEFNNKVYLKINPGNS